MTDVCNLQLRNIRSNESTGISADYYLFVFTIQCILFCAIFVHGP